MGESRYETAQHPQTVIKTTFGVLAGLYSSRTRAELACSVPMHLEKRAALGLGFGL